MTQAVSSRSRTLTAAVFTGLLLACALLIFRLSAERQDILDDFRRSTWLAVQAQAEFLRLSDALSRYEAVADVSHRAELERRFDVFWSRFPLFASGKESEQLREIQGIPELVADLTARLPRAEAAIDAIVPADAASFQSARQTVEEFRDPLQSLVLTVVHNQGFTTSRARIERQYAWTLAAMVAVLASGTLLVLGLRREAENARANYELARRAEAEASTLKEQLVDAIESVSEGFILLDETGNVVMANSRYRELHPTIGSMVEPGVAFQDLAWASAVLGQFDGDDPVEKVVRNRMERLAHPNGPFEQILADGRTLLVAERRTARRSLVSVCTDITELKRTQLALQRRLAAMEASTASRSSTCRTGWSASTRLSPQSSTPLLRSA